MGAVENHLDECAMFLCENCRVAIADLRKQVADANAERIKLETMLVDAMATLQHYGSAYQSEIGTRARVALRRILDAGAQFARIAEAGNEHR